MKDLLNKISSYNIFNYLLPGVIFVVFAKKMVGYDLFLDDAVLGTFLYYFIGMVVSRVGSLIIEPFLRKVRFLKFSDYRNFIIASKQDEKIELLSEVNNTYRTISSMLFILLTLKVYKHFEHYWNIPGVVMNITGTVLLLCLFVFSYRKQTAFLNSRIQSTINSNHNSLTT